MIVVACPERAERILQAGSMHCPRCPGRLRPFGHGAAALGCTRPTYPAIYRTSCAHEEGGVRLFGVDTVEFLGDEAGRLRAILVTDGVRDDRQRFHPSGAVRELPAQLALIALGFVGPERSRLLAELGVALDGPGTVARDQQFMTSLEGVFAAGDVGRGQSLVVWAIAEGRAAAAGVDAYLTGRDLLPCPIHPTDMPVG